MRRHNHDCFEQHHLNIFCVENIQKYTFTEIQYERIRTKAHYLVKVLTYYTTQNFIRIIYKIVFIAYIRLYKLYENSV